jgi:hypothetical protein
MTAITTAAISTVECLQKRFTSRPGQDKRMVEVWLRMTVDCGADLEYVTGGMPLTELFTAGAANNTSIDPAEPVWGLSSHARLDGACTPAAQALFYDGAATAVGKTLVLLDWIEAGASARINLTEVASATDLGALFGATTDYVVDLYLCGTEQ